MAAGLLEDLFGQRAQSGQAAEFGRTLLDRFHVALVEFRRPAEQEIGCQVVQGGKADRKLPRLHAAPFAQDRFGNLLGRTLLVRRHGGQDFQGRVLAPRAPRSRLVEIHRQRTVVNLEQPIQGVDHGAGIHPEIAHCVHSRKLAAVLARSNKPFHQMNKTISGTVTARQNRPGPEHSGIAAAGRSAGSASKTITRTTRT